MALKQLRSTDLFLLTLILACLSCLPAGVTWAGAMTFGKAGFETDVSHFLIKSWSGSNCVTTTANTSTSGTYAGVPAAVSPCTTTVGTITLPGVGNTGTKSILPPPPSYSSVLRASNKVIGSPKPPKPAPTLASSAALARWTYTPGKIIDTGDYTVATNAFAAPPVGVGLIGNWANARAVSSDPVVFQATPNQQYLRLTAALDSLAIQVPDGAGEFAGIRYDYFLDGQSLFDLQIQVPGGFQSIQDLQISFVSDAGSAQDAAVRSALIGDSTHPGWLSLDPAQGIVDLVSPDPDIASLILYANSTIPIPYDSNLSQDEQPVHVLTGEFIAYASVVPEPSTVGLLGIGLAGLGFGRRKKQLSTAL